MDFYLYSPVCFEKWDWRSSVKTGIGGSETSHVEMAWRLAARGHKVGEVFMVNSVKLVLFK